MLTYTRSCILEMLPHKVTRAWRKREKVETVNGSLESSM